MENLILDRRAQSLARGGTPHGYILSNGVVVVYSGESGRTNNNMSTLEHAQKLFPNLVIVEYATSIVAKPIN